jgi:hypothetical protein
MRAPLLAVAVLALILGCTEDLVGVPDGTTPSSGPVAGASPLRAPVSSRDLSGNWIFGERKEPGPGAVATCGPSQSLAIAQNDEALNGQVSTCAGGNCNTIETFEGTNQDGLVQGSGQYKGNFSQSPEPVAYVLKYDANTQHLTGTRNGRPFWAAPWVTPAPGCEKSAIPDF